jgi:hypothetical protein
LFFWSRGVRFAITLSIDRPDDLLAGVKKLFYGPSPHQEVSNLGEPVGCEESAPLSFRVGAKNLRERERTIMALTPKMEPVWSTGKNEPPEFAHVLITGAPKIGKTCVAVGTMPAPVYVINSDQSTSLGPVNRVHTGTKYAANFVHGGSAMEDALLTARNLVREGKVKTIVWDTMSGWCPQALDECVKKNLTSNGNENGLKYWPAFRKCIENTVSRLLKIPAHVVVCSHYENTGGEPIEGALPKEGPGICPNIPGSAKYTIGKFFDDVIHMEKDRAVSKTSSERVFRLSIQGVWGPGSRNAPADVTTIPADFREWMKLCGFKGIAGAPLRSVK